MEIGEFKLPAKIRVQFKTTLLDLLCDVVFRGGKFSDTNITSWVG